MRKRTRARELALKALYQLDLRGTEALDGLEHLFRDELAEADVRVYAKQLIDGCRSLQGELDGRITAVAENWELHRMAVIDRNVLRLASYELLYVDDVPPKVTINEAINLAKRFSTADSGAFVNGILDRIRLNAEPPTD